MNSWQDFASQAPEMAAFGLARFGGGVAYLATIQADGSPRVHPVTPIIGEQLFLFMEPNSPKGKDLQRGSGYALHCSVANNEGGEGEFYVRGRATLITEPHIREQAIQAAAYTPRERYILFILSVESAFMNRYINGQPTIQRWPSPNP